MPAIIQISDETCLRLFLTLFHFLWQGAAIGLVVIVGESAMRGGTPKSRYALSFGALVCMPVCVIATFLLVDGSFWTSVTNSVDQPSQALGSGLVGLDELSGSLTPENLPPEVQSADSPTKNSSAGSLTGLAGWSSFAARPISIGYGLCVGVLLLRVVIAICGGCKLRAIAKPTQDSRTLEILEAQAKRIGLAIIPFVSYCQRSTVPAVIGIVRPVILLPVSMMGLETAHLSAIISHELAHIRRNDLLINLVQRFIESFLFFHPVTWYLSRRVSVEREICCDEIVLASGSSNVVYAQALLEMAEQSIGGVGSRVTSLAVTGDNTSEFERRIQTILHGRPKTRLRLGRPVLLMLACIVLSIPGVLHAWPGGQSAITTKDLIEKTRTTESKIRTLSVTINLSNISRQLSRTGPVEAKGNYVETWHVHTAGMGWSEGQGTAKQRNADGTTTVSKEEFSASFDGKEGKRILQTFLDGSDHTFASIEKGLKGRTQSPLQFVERVSSMIEAGGYEIADPQAWDGRQVIVVEKLHITPIDEKPNRRTEIWIDPELQFTVVRRRQFKLSEQSGDWDIDWSRDSHDHQQLADGVWLPQRGSHVVYQSPDNTKVVNEYVFTNWKLNVEIDEKKLRLDFPPGIRVRNAK